MKKSSALTFTCFAIASLIAAGCGDDATESTPSECTGEGCDEQPEVCNPACEEGDICRNGHCYTCNSSGKCYLNDVIIDDRCETKDDCEAGMICQDGDCLPDPNASACDPACVDGQVCTNGTCVNATLLWTLCQSDSDCGITNGTCTFTVAPSKPMTYKGQEYGNGVNIPVSLLDERINVQNYNATHKFPATATSTIGICTQNCSTQNECEEGFTCQLVAEADPIYPSDVQLPVDLPQDDLAKPGFAAICRRVMNEKLAEDMPYNAEFCNKDEDKCKTAGGVFVDGMCLNTCDPAANSCPYTFSCENVGGQNVCMPNTRTCSACHDEDKDGYGYGHCAKQGIDCDDANPDVHYDRTMTCDDVADKTPTDLNCNGLIDYFEMVGTPDNCNACGDTCYADQSNNSKIACIPSNGVTIDDDWRKTASFENTTKLPDFTCVLTCDFGWGNCYDTDKPNGCETQLYNDKTDTTTLHVSAVSGNANVWGADYDGDGYIGVNNPKTQEMGEIVFNGAHTLLCCNTDTENKCYEANADWKTVTRPPSTVQVQNVKSPSSYDVNDEDENIHPNEPEHCDGRDNDGSLILAQSAKLPDCKTYCATPGIDCKSLKIEIDGKYEFNTYCDASVDGSAETTLWYDTSEKQSSNKGLTFGETCSLRHATNEVCDANAIVSCTNMQEVRCYPGTDHCACYYADTGAVQYLTESGYIGRLGYKVKNALGDISTELCKCDGTDTASECTIQCNTFCVKKYEKDENSYALACTTNLNKAATSEEPGATTVQADGMDEKGNIVFNGFDENCNGIPDEDAMLPCLITLTDEQAPYNYVDASGQQFGYITGVSNDDATRYSLYRNYADHENYDSLFESDEKSAIRNADGSINICRLGWLQPNKKLVTDASGNASYTYAAPKCVPLFEPRQFDFMGDGVDSNCDGVDYDLQNAVYVANSNVQLSTGSICKGSTCKCDYHAASTPGADRYPTPCDSLTTAVKVAQNDTRFFYKDILILNSETISLGSGIEVPRFNKQPNLPTAQLLTTLTDASLGESAAVNHYNLVEGSTKLIRNGHILSPYALHREFIRRKLQGEDINQYLFAYERINDDVGVNTVEGYQNGTIYEKLVPDEQVRIFGGLQATYKAADAKPWVPKAQWNVSKENTSSIDYTVPTVDKQTYAMFAPATSTATDRRLSLGLYNLKLTMQATSTAKDQLNGTTFTGINGYLGIEKLTFKNTTLEITAPSGYSFTNDTSDLIVTPTRPEQAKSGSHKGAVCKEDTDVLPTNSCKFGVKDVNEVEKSGGAGGRGGYSNSGCSSPSPSAGQQGFSSYFYDVIQKTEVYTTEGGQGGVLGNETGGCAHNDWGDNDFNNVNSQGNPGSQGDPGEHGAFGKSTKMFSWTPKIVNDDALYIDSDRSGGRGYYGGIGSGGGGGGVFRCVKQHLADDRSCYAANGGLGGCGGEGGEAGGTGGSAFGIVARSTSATSQTVINFDETSKISVTNGIGGSSQLGALGQGGGMGGNHNGYAREKYAGAWYDMECIRSACGGGGGAGGVGGSGAAGHVGWPFPLVLICEVTESSLSDFNVSEIGGKQLKSCGFDIAPRLTNAEQDNKDNGAMAVTYQKANYNKCDKNFVTTLSLKSNITPISNIVDIPLTPVEDLTIDGLTRATHYYGKDNFTSCLDPLTKTKVNIEFCGSQREKKCAGQDSVYPNMPTVCTPVDSTNATVDQSMLTPNTKWEHQYIKVLRTANLGQKVESNL